MGVGWWVGGGGGCVGVTCHPIMLDKGVSPVWINTGLILRINEWDKVMFSLLENYNWLTNLTFSHHYHQ